MEDYTNETNVILNRIKTGSYLQGLRKSQGKSLQEVGETVGVSANYISEIERGIKTPSDHLIRQLAAYFDIAENDLFEMYGKVPFLAVNELDKFPQIRLTLSEIGANKKLTDDQRQELYDHIHKLYLKMLKEFEKE